MTSPSLGHATGPLALVGSGEYTRSMDATDVALLRASGVAQPRVAVIPTASGLEPGMPEAWNARGVHHFTRLGARVTPLMITERAHCDDAAIVRTLADTDFFYFSGGNPNHVVETWRGTAALDVLLERWHAGAALAGCSAGAMMMGARTIRVRDAMAGSTPSWVPALDILPGLAVLPHFDRMRHFLTDDRFGRVLSTAPAGLTIVGIDEDSALTHIDGAWQAAGRQRVTVFDAAGNGAAYAAGDYVPLPGFGAA